MKSTRRGTTSWTKPIVIKDFGSNKTESKQKVPEPLIICGGSNSFLTKIGLQTIDTHDRTSVEALIDSGATGSFIDETYAKHHFFNVKPLQKAIPVFNVDGTPNQSGRITGTVELLVRFQNHQERMSFGVTNLGK